MGAGKTTVGRLVAAAMDWSFVDLDESIERRAATTIAAIFEQRGESAFRHLESEALAEVAGRERVVVATGGGVMTSASNRALMAGAGTTVWLAADFELLAERLADDPQGVRPLFRDRRRARELFDGRQAGYAEADLKVVVTAGDAPDAVAARVVRGLTRRAPGGGGGDRCAT